MVLAGSPGATSYDFDPSLADPEEAKVMHWAGTTRPGVHRQPRRDILSFFQRAYYRDCNVPKLERASERLDALASWARWRGRIKLEYALGLR